jgi:hypothetical protein
MTSSCIATTVRVPFSPTSAVLSLSYILFRFVVFMDTMLVAGLEWARSRDGE